MILAGVEAEYMRNIFLASFIDVNSKYYRHYIERKALFSDGWCYTGYLWECIQNKKTVSNKYILEHINMQKGPIYILWDIHSSERIVIHDYWKYPKEAVLKVDANNIESIIDELPEDCYFFDQTLSWIAAFTHEEIKPGKRMCFFAKTTE